MADSKISDLAAASALAAADIAPVVQGGANVKATVQQIITAATGATGTNGETVTTSKPRADLTQTWNAAGTTFTGFKLNVTDTASAAGSLLADFQVGGVSRFSLTKSGSSILGGRASINPGTYNGELGFAGNTAVTSGFCFYTNQNNLSATVRSDGYFGFSATTTNDGNSTVDARLFRDAANTLAQRNGVNAQAHRVYGTYTDASNYRRLTKSMSAAGVAEIKPEGAGTGATGNVLHISGLPTSNPGPGILWNNLGVVSVGT